MSVHTNCVQLWYTVQNRTVLIIFPLILQTITMALYWKGGNITGSDYNGNCDGEDRTSTASCGKNLTKPH